MRTPFDDSMAIEFLLQQSVKKARAVFKETYGVAHNDKDIDLEIEKQFDERDSGSDIVLLPAKFVLAVMLRDGFGGRTRGKRKIAIHLKRIKPFKIESAKVLEAELLETGHWKRWLQSTRSFSPEKAREIEDKLRLGRRLSRTGARDKACKIMAMCSKFSESQYRRWLRRPRKRAAEKASAA